MCGCHSYHYSHNRRAMSCDMCGHMFKNEQQQEDDMNYDNCITLAREHLQVGNWETCKRMVKPLCSKRPADKQLYLILLAATTKGYEDYLFDNASERAEASEYWDKLTKLNCVNNAMREYANKRMQKKEEIRNQEVSFITLIICLCILTTIMTFVFALAESTFCGLMAVITIIGWIYGIKLIKKNHNPTIDLRKICVNGKNPFI